MLYVSQASTSMRMLSGTFCLWACRLVRLRRPSFGSLSPKTGHFGFVQLGTLSCLVLAHLLKDTLTVGCVVRLGVRLLANLLRFGCFACAKNHFAPGLALS